MISYGQFLCSITFVCNTLIFIKINKFNRASNKKTLAPEFYVFINVLLILHYEELLFLVDKNLFNCVGDYQVFNSLNIQPETAQILVIPRALFSLLSLSIYIKTVTRQFISPSKLFMQYNSPNLQDFVFIPKSLSPSECNIFNQAQNLLLYTCDICNCAVPQTYHTSSCCVYYDHTCSWVGDVSLPNYYHFVSFILIRFISQILNLVANIYLLVFVSKQTSFYVAFSGLGFGFFARILSSFVQIVILITQIIVINERMSCALSRSGFKLVKKINRLVREGKYKVVEKEGFWVCEVSAENTMPGIELEQLEKIIQVLNKKCAKGDKIKWIYKQRNALHALK
ncbi:Palmitoyltransferase [Hexamita inflata]|uniref:Palmitoyltransferase n=1 Tax=Hexamita inflata TaxID=28002 RepID=A0AA86QKE4_9EUKA|nr:Palmitoyltransferase [Hexamita inflata]